MEVIFILAAVLSFLTSLKSVLNTRGYSSILTVSSGILALTLAAIAYDMYSVLLLAISLCLTVFSWVCMLHDKSKQKKRMKRYINSSECRRRSERQKDIERLFNRTDY